MRSRQRVSEKEALEVLKLQQELRFGKISLCLSIIGSMVLLFGLGLDRWTAHEQRERALKLELYSQKRESYLALADAACAIAACRSYEEVEKASVEFNKIYYGRAHIIVNIDDDVYTAKKAFHRALTDYLEHKRSVSPEDFFGDFALDLTLACRPNIDPGKQN